MGSSARARAQAGFTLVEVLVASSILLVGVLGTLTVIDTSNLQTTTIKAREQGVALERELIESARSVPYAQLNPNGIVATLQAMPDLGDDQPGTPGWQIRRRNATYTVAVGTCSVDDPGDGLGNDDTATFCATNGTTTAAQCAQLLGNSGSIQGTSAAASAGAAAGDCGIDLDLDGQVDNLTQAQAAAAGGNLCSLGWCPASAPDTNPDDYKRVVVLVRWAVGTGSRYALQNTTVPNPGSSAAPQVTAIAPASGQANVQNGNVVTGGTSVTFNVTTSRPPASVAWLQNGTATGTASGSGTSWTFPWSLGNVDTTGSTANAGELLDGIYLIEARAYDAYGAYGQSKSISMTLNRRAPYPPAQFDAGRNTKGSGAPSVVDFEWAKNKESDVVGYRVYRVADGGDVQVCPANAGDTQLSTTCEAGGQPLTGPLSYYVVAYDHDPSGALRASTPASTAVAVSDTDTPPEPPGGLLASSSGGNTILTWTASAGDPDPGDSVAFYRIYRDGQAYANRYDRTPTGSQLTYTDTSTGGVAHTYWVVAVDTQLAESTFSNGVTR